MFDFAACDATEGWMGEDELRWLHDQAVSMRSVLEVGCWRGRSALALAQGCQGPVYTVDHFQGSPTERDGVHLAAASENLYAVAQNTLAPYPQVKVVPLESRLAARLFRRESLDMVFIDGDHEPAAVLADLLLWHPKVTRLFCGHDRDFEGVLWALVTFGLPWQEGPGSLWYSWMEPR